jgi:hypothetical protein
MGRAARSRIVVGFLAAVMVVLGGGWAAANETAVSRGSGDQGGEALYGCDRTLGRQPEGHLHKLTDPAEESPVRPGETVRVTITWDTADWSGRSPRSDYDRQISNKVCHTVERSTEGGRRGGACGKCGGQCGPKDEGAGCGQKNEGGAKPGDCNTNEGCKKGGGEKTCGDEKNAGDAGGCAKGGGKCDYEDDSSCAKSECGKQMEGGDCGEGDCAGKSDDCGPKGSGGNCECAGKGHRRGLISRLLPGR